MAPMVVAANSRGRYSRLPAEQRVNSEFMLGPRAAVARIAHQVQNGCRRSNAHLLVKTRRDRGHADGADGRVKWDRSKRLRRRAACPLVRSRRATAVDRVLGSAARCGGRRRRAIKDHEQSNSGAVERTCTLVVRAGSGAREPGAQSLARARPRCCRCARARAHTQRHRRRSVSTEITLTYRLVCALVFRAPGDSPTRRASHDRSTTTPTAPRGAPEDSIHGRRSPRRAIAQADRRHGYAVACFRPI